MDSYRVTYWEKVTLIVSDRYHAVDVDQDLRIKPSQYSTSQDII